MKKLARFGAPIVLALFLWGCEGDPPTEPTEPDTTSTGKSMVQRVIDALS